MVLVAHLHRVALVHGQRPRELLRRSVEPDRETLDPRLRESRARAQAVEEGPRVGHGRRAVGQAGLLLVGQQVDALLLVGAHLDRLAAVGQHGCGEPHEAVGLDRTVGTHDHHAQRPHALVVAGRLRVAGTRAAHRGVVGHRHADVQPHLLRLLAAGLVGLQAAAAARQKEARQECDGYMYPGFHGYSSESLIRTVQSLILMKVLSQRLSSPRKKIHDHSLSRSRNSCDPISA